MLEVFLPTTSPQLTKPPTPPCTPQRDVASLFSVWVVREARGCAAALKRNALAAAAATPAGGLSATVQVCTVPEPGPARCRRLMGGT
jgi:hypothetical protein